MRALLVMCVHPQKACVLHTHVLMLQQMKACGGQTKATCCFRNIYIHSLACTLCLQILENEGSSMWPLVDVCTILFAASSQLQRLTVSIRHDPLKRFVCLPHKLIVMMTIATSLESLLTLAVPENANFKTLAETVHSLRKLKVQRFGICSYSACV